MNMKRSKLLVLFLLASACQWDPQTEKFAGDDQANKHVARPRRKGYGLPPVG